ncbi:MAG: hypothetical protein J6B09_01095 [Clostridia bacterium]|nr:hypothetical protein [Clostridia bacterium]
MNIRGNKEKFAKIYNELYEKYTRDILNNFNVITCALIYKYFQLQPGALDYALTRFLYDEVCEILKKEESSCVDITDVTIGECLPCAAFCIDLLQAYDEWRKSGEAHE